jgi:predicted phosphodiesterase
VVVLAGDIWEKGKGIHWARATWPDTEIVYVAGNHEFYHGERNEVLQTLRVTANEMNVHFLDNDEVVIGGVRFLGATLWTDFNLFGDEKRDAAMSAGKRSLNDFEVIDNGSLQFSPEDAANLCSQSAEWINAKLNEDTYPGKTVVVTHHLPSMRSVASRYKKDMLSACFASNLDVLFGCSELWIHGHTHDSFDYTVNGTRIVCNPRGYVFNRVLENSRFNPEFVVEI